MKRVSAPPRFTPDIGTIDEAYCDVCGADMLVERGNFGATGFAEGMGGGGHHYDLFTCPEIDAKWHRQICAIRKEMRNTSSFVLETLMAQEVAAILKTRKPTKKNFSLW